MTELGVAKVKIYADNGVNWGFQGTNTLSYYKENEVLRILPLWHKKFL